MMRWCMLMCVDVNKNTLLSEKNVFYFTHTHTKTRCLSEKNVTLSRLNVYNSNSDHVRAKRIAFVTLQRSQLVQVVVAQITR